MIADAHHMLSYMPSAGGVSENSGIHRAHVRKQPWLMLVLLVDTCYMWIPQDVEKKIEGITVPVYGSNSDSLTGSNALKDKCFAPGELPGRCLLVSSKRFLFAAAVLLQLHCPV